MEPPRISQNDIILVRGLHGAYQKIISALTSEEDEILILTPEYHSLTTHILNLGRTPSYVDFKKTIKNNQIHYQLDVGLLKQKITHKTKMFIFSSPHNPTGHVFTKNELLNIVNLCLEHNIFLVVSEIWSELILEDTPFCSISNTGGNAWDKLILLNSISKTFNTSSFKSGYLVIRNPKIYNLLNEHLEQDHALAISELGGMTIQWCIENGDNYQKRLINYLKINRAFILNFLANQMPYVQCTDMSATYVAWIDFSALKLNNPIEFLLENARVSLSEGSHHGPGQEQFARLLFACPKSLLEEALLRIKTACDSVYL